METLLENNQKWDFLINLSGMDFPIKSNLEIAAQLKTLKGSIIGSTLREQKQGSWLDRQLGRTTKVERYMNRYVLKVQTNPFVANTKKKRFWLPDLRIN